MSNLVERLLWHVEQVCGPLSEEVCEVDGDDDRSVLRGAFTAEVATQAKRLEKLDRDFREIAHVCNSTTTEQDGRIEKLEKALRDCAIYFEDAAEGVRMDAANGLWAGIEDRVGDSVSEFEGYATAMRVIASRALEE